MIDIHTHVLPGVDDGAGTWEMAVHMCHMAAQDGISHVVATPHANDEYVYDRQGLESVLAELSQRSDAVVDLTLGCDFHFSYDNLSLLEQDPHRFTIGNTRYLLVEFSDFSVPPWITGKLQDLLDTGLVPIITHPERNMLLQADLQRVVHWAEIGCPIQVTANSLTGRWGDRALKSAQWLLKKNAVHIVASDCHNVEGRPPILSVARKAIEKAVGPDIATAVVADNPKAVVDNLDLPYFPQLND